MSLFLIICVNGAIWPPKPEGRVSFLCPFTSIPKGDFWVTDGSLDDVLFVNFPGRPFVAVVLL